MKFKLTKEPDGAVLAAALLAMRAGRGTLAQAGDVVALAAMLAPPVVTFVSDDETILVATVTTGQPHDLMLYIAVMGEDVDLEPLGKFLRLLLSTTEAVKVARAYTAGRLLDLSAAGFMHDGVMRLQTTDANGQLADVHLWTMMPQGEAHGGPVRAGEGDEERHGTGEPPGRGEGTASPPDAGLAA